MDVGDRRLDASDVEIELARLALELARPPGCTEDASGLAARVRRRAATLLACLPPADRHEAGERIRQLVRCLADVDIGVVDMAKNRFGPATGMHAGPATADRRNAGDR